jgi:hypothetical protein
VPVSRAAFRTPGPRLVRGRTARELQGPRSEPGNRRKPSVGTVSSRLAKGAAESEVHQVGDFEKDVKKGYREAEETAKEKWRKSDGITDTDDKVANLGDDVKKNLGNMGDEAKEAWDNVTDEVTKNR